jgi:hypothetical protein
MAGWELTCESGEGIFDPAASFAAKMKTMSKSTKTRANGTPHSRSELLAAHERALKGFKRMAAHDRFESLVRAGIYTRDGKLTPRYGG